MIDLLLSVMLLVMPARTIAISPPAPQMAIATITAYSSSVDETDDTPFIMASGKRVYDGAIANNCLDFGTEVEWNGKIYTVEDRKNSRYGCEWYDVWMPSKDEAIEFGIKRNQKIIINN